MAIPCENQEHIDLIKKGLSSVQGINGKLEDALVRLAQASESHAAEMREMTQTITVHMLDNREFRVNLARGKEERDQLFSKNRDLSESMGFLTKTLHVQELKVQRAADALVEVDKVLAAIPKLQNFQNKMLGGMLVIPGLFTFISLVLVWYSNYGGG